MPVSLVPSGSVDIVYEQEPKWLLILQGVSRAVWAIYALNFKNISIC